MALRRSIHDEVCREGWNEGLSSFTPYYGGQEIDASLLLPLVGFLPADDPRMAATIETIRRDLTEDGLVRRLKAKSGKTEEGAFLACSCWMADCLSLQGRHEEARAQFERVLAVCNDVGLLSEEYDVPAKHLAGNFPQALTHLAVVNTALGLSGPRVQRKRCQAALGDGTGTHAGRGTHMSEQDVWVQSAVRACAILRVCNLW